MGLKNIMLDTQSEKGKKYYTKMLKFLDSPNRKIFDNPEKLIQDSRVKSGQTVLEIGCGSGYFTETISKMVGEKGKVYATDIQQIAIDETHKKVDRLGLKNVIVQIDDALNSSFANDTFDVVLLFGVVPAPIIPMDTISQENCRILKPGGVYVVWSKVPLWTPKIALKCASYDKMKKSGKVFLLHKASN